VEEDKDGIKFKVTDICKLMVVILSSWDELCLDSSRKGVVLREVTNYLQAKRAGFEAGEPPASWKAVKISLAAAHIMPLHIVKTRMGETGTKKISKVYPRALVLLSFFCVWG
jgi:hypothetical protein